MRDRAQMGPRATIPVFLGGAVLVGIVVANEAAKFGIVPAVAGGVIASCYVLMAIVTATAVLRAVKQIYRGVSHD